MGQECIEHDRLGHIAIEDRWNARAARLREQCQRALPPPRIRKNDVGVTHRVQGKPGGIGWQIGATEVDEHALAGRIDDDAGDRRTRALKEPQMGCVHAEGRQLRAHRRACGIITGAAPELRACAQSCGCDGRRRSHSAAPTRIGGGGRLAAAVR